MHARAVLAWAILASSVAAPIATASADWSMYRGGPARAGAPDAAGPRAGGLVWSVTFPVSQLTSTLPSPVISGGAVFLAVPYDTGSGTEGHAYAYDLATGTPRWGPVVLNATVGVAGAVADGAYYVASNKVVGTVYALDASTGAVRWTRTFGKEVVNAPVAADGRVHVLVNDGTVAALDAADGHVVWAARSEARLPNTNSLAIAGGRGFFGIVGGPGCNKPCSNDLVYGIDLADGHDVWRVDPTEASSTDDDIATTPAVQGSRVFIAAHGFKAFTDPDGAAHPAVPSRLFALDATTGAPLWKQESASGDFSDPNVAAGAVLAGTGDGVAHAFDAATGAERWSRRLHDQLTTPIIVAGAVAYVGSVDTVPATGARGTDGRVHALDVADGHDLWPAVTLVGVPTRSAAAAHGRLAQVSVAGTTLKLSVFGDGMEPSPSSAPTSPGTRAGSTDFTSTAATTTKAAAPKRSGTPAPDATLLLTVLAAGVVAARRR